jgi:hypothetical protein
MTDEQIKKQIETILTATKEALRSKKAARKFLRDAGIPIGDEPFGDKKKNVRHA